MAKVVLATEQQFVPFGQLSLASSLRSKGIDTEFVLRVHKKPDFFDRLSKEKPDVVGFSVYDYTAPAIDIFFDRIREASPSTFIAIGGPLPSADLEGSVLVTTADFAIGGAGEYVFPDAIKILEGSEPSRGIGDIVEAELRLLPSFYGVFNGNEVRGKKQKNILRGNLDDLPLDLSLMESAKSIEAFPLITSRGCGYLTCTFCSAPSYEGKWNGMSAEKMIEFFKELKGLIEEEKLDKCYKKIMIQDNDFLYDRERFLNFAEMFKAEGLDKFFTIHSAQTSVDTLFIDHEPKKGIDKNIVAVAKSLFESLNVGTDGFTDAELKRLGKDRYTMKHVEQAVKALHDDNLIQRHYAIISNYESSILDIMKACFNIIRLGMIFNNFIPDGNTGVQAFVGTRAYKQVLPSVGRGEQDEAAMLHHTMSPYFEISGCQHPWELRSSMGYQELRKKGETKYPIFIPHITPREMMADAFIDLLGDYCRKHSPHHLGEQVMGLAIMKRIEKKSKIQ